MEIELSCKTLTLIEIRELVQKRQNEWTTISSDSERIVKLLVRLGDRCFQVIRKGEVIYEGFSDQNAYIIFNHTC